MTISTDRVKPSPVPNRWKIRSIVLGAVSLALSILVLSFGIFLYARDVLHLPLAQLQTLLFTMLVFSGQGTIYIIRNSDHFWRTAPSRWMIIGTTLDIILVTLLASQGVLMVAVPLRLVLENLGIIAAFLIFLDFIKVPVFSRLKLR
jgi:H+-transporting ATPase